MTNPENINKRGSYCQTCKMFACAVEKGIDFCVDCEDFPCHDLKQFQSERPHRIELWDDLERIRAIGYKQWLKETTPVLSARALIPPMT